MEYKILCFGYIELNAPNVKLLTIFLGISLYNNEMTNKIVSRMVMKRALVIPTDRVLVKKYFLKFILVKIFLMFFSARSSYKDNEDGKTTMNIIAIDNTPEPLTPFKNKNILELSVLSVSIFKVTLNINMTAAKKTFFKFTYLKAVLKK